MEEKRTRLQNEYEELEKQMQEPDFLRTASGQQAAKRYAQTQHILSLFDRKDALERQREETEKLLKDTDQELSELAHTEYDELDAAITALESELETALIPKDPRDDKAAVIEIRAGAGGDEASLFAGSLYRMYTRYCEDQGWPVELITQSPSGIGGFKEVSFQIQHPGAYGALKFESGVHRVQRIPDTESSGRIHTSTASVAVLPEAEEHDVEIQEADLRIDTFRSSGPGGQSVNTTDSAVRITHLPTDITVTCQDEKSQHKNRDKALGILRSRLLAAKIEEEAQARADERKDQIGSGDRSEKIRTYNFPQDRITDHRIQLSVHDLPNVLDGQLQPMLDALHTADFEHKKQSQQ